MTIGVRQVARALLEADGFDVVGEAAVKHGNEPRG
jgi:hypothetical protein